ncbi:MAG: GntR family transcriptional regulator [Bacteroidota bacterium]
MIRKFGTEEMIQLHRVREACEGVAAYDACLKITDEQIEGLKSLFKPFFNVTDWTPELIKQYLKADIKFHETILEIAGNPFVTQTLNSLGFLYFTYQRGLLQSPEITIKDHLAIISCFIERNPESARNAIEKHLLKGRENISHY